MGQSAWHVAALWGHVEAGQAMVDLGVNVHAANALSGATPLHMVVQPAAQGQSFNKNKSWTFHWSPEPIPPFQITLENCLWIMLSWNNSRPKPQPQQQCQELLLEQPQQDDGANTTDTTLQDRFQILQLVVAALGGGEKKGWFGNSKTGFPTFTTTSVTANGGGMEGSALVLSAGLAARSVQTTTTRTIILTTTTKTPSPLRCQPQKR